MLEHAFVCVAKLRKYHLGHRLEAVGSMLCNIAPQLRHEGRQLSLEAVRIHESSDQSGSDAAEPVMKLRRNRFAQITVNMLAVHLRKQICCDITTICALRLEKMEGLL